MIESIESLAIGGARSVLVEELLNTFIINSVRFALNCEERKEKLHLIIKFSCF